MTRTLRVGCRTPGRCDTGRARAGVREAFESEPAIAGMAAATCTDSSTSGPQSPTRDEAAALLADCGASRAEPFTAGEQAGAAAMVTWTSAYDARCLIDVQRLGHDLPEGHALDAPADDAPEHVQLR